MQLLSMKQKHFESTVNNFGDSLFEHTLSEYPVQFDKINVEKKPKEQKATVVLHWQ
jgi:hypothetical protein